MYKNANEVAARLAQPYDGTIEQREGPGGKMFSYVPWTETYRRLNDVFGTFGWSTTAPHSYFANGTYNVEFGLSATVIDENGEIYTKTVPAQGQAVARNEKDDNALKSAQSDALSRGAKLFGDTFGFQLYEQRTPQTASQPQTQTQSYTIKDPNAPASEKQVAALVRGGYSHELASRMTKGQASAAIDAIKNAPKPHDDLPF